MSGSFWLFWPSSCRVSFPLDAFIATRYYPKRTKLLQREGIIFTMMKNLRGRNLKHPGCLTGITVGVILGIILAGVMASVYNVPLNTILWTWLAIILFLGALGWIIGSRLSARFPAEKSNAEVAPENSPVVTDEVVTSAPPVN